MLSVAQAAAILKVSERRVQQWIKDERLPATRVGRDWVIQERAVERFAAIPRKTGHPFARRRARG